MLTLDPVAAALLALCGAVLFASAGLHKLRAMARFEAVLTAYRLLPARVVPPTARFVPVVELSCAVGLLVGSTRSWSAAIGAGLLLVYAGAMTANLRRGRAHIDCGCAGFGLRRPLSAWMVARNAAISLLLLVLVPQLQARALAWTDALTLLGGAIVVCSLYAAADALLGVMPPMRNLPQTQVTDSFQ